MGHSASGVVVLGGLARHVTCPSADRTAGVCRLLLPEVLSAIAALPVLYTRRFPRAGHVSLSKNFPENLVVPSDHLAVIVRT